jgi:hypothetical protein
VAFQFTTLNTRLSASTGVPAARIWTATCWVYLTGDRNDYSNAFAISDGTNYISAGFGLSGTIRYCGWEGGDLVATTNAVNAAEGSWTRLAVVCDGTIVKLYWGDETGDLYTRSATGTPPTTPSVVYVGADQWTTSYLNGRVAGFKLWQAALSETEVAAEFTQYAPVRTTNLLRRHDFLVAPTAGYADQSGNGFSALAANGTAPALVAGPNIPVTVSGPPIANAGTTPVPLELGQTFSRTAAPDANGGTISARSWVILSGPTGSNIPLTTADAVLWTPTVIGTYVLRYSVTTELGTTTDDVTVTVTPQTFPLDLTLVGSSAWSTGAASSTSIALPSGLQEKDRCYLFVVSKPTSGSVNTPLNWTPAGVVNSNAGTAGAGTGPMRTTIFYRDVPSGGLTGPVTVSQTTSGVIMGMSRAYRPTNPGPNLQWSESFAALQTAATTSLANSGSLTGLALQAKDRLSLVLAVTDSNVTTASIGVSNPGVTFGTYTQQPNSIGTSTVGNRISGVAWDVPVVSGVKTSDTVTVTGSTNATEYSLLSLFRIRARSESPAAPPVVSAGTDVSNHLLGTAFTRTGTLVSGDAATSHEWKIVSAPSPTDAPYKLLNLGTGAGQNHFKLQHAPTTNLTDDIETLLPDLAAGYINAETFYIAPSNDRVYFAARADAARTSESAGGARSELRELNPDGSEIAFDPRTGTHWAQGRSSVVTGPAEKPQITVAQLHTGNNDAVNILSTISGTTVRIQIRFNGTSAAPGGTVITPYTLGTEFDWRIEIVPTDGVGAAIQTCNVYINGTLTNTVPVSTLYNRNTSSQTTTYMFKAGDYNGFLPADISSSTAYGRTSLRNLSHWHTGWATPVPYPSDLAGTILNNTSADLNWTPPVEGTYVLRYTCTNAGGSGYDDMTITVVNIPPAPTVNAGLDTSITNRTLLARTADESGVSITDRSWTILSGPAGVGTEIGDGPSLLWTPTVSGTYVLQYSATNAGGTTTDTTTITVIPVVTGVSGVATAIATATGAIVVHELVEISGTATVNASITPQNLKATVLLESNLGAVTSANGNIQTTYGYAPELTAEATVTGFLIGTKPVTVAILAEGSAVGDVLALRPLDADVLYAEVSVKKANLAPPGGGRATVGASATGDLLQLPAIRGRATVDASASMFVGRVRIFVPQTLVAEASSPSLLTTVTRSQIVSKATADSAVLGVLVVSQPFEKHILEAVSAISEPTPERLRLIDGRASAEADVLQSYLKPITGFKQVFLAEATTSQTLNRATNAETPSRAEAEASMELGIPNLVRMRTLKAAKLIGQTLPTPVKLWRAVPYYREIDVESFVYPINLRVVRNLRFNQLIAETTLTEGHIRRVLTTAHVDADVLEAISNNVTILSGYITAQAGATGELVLGPIRHLALAEASMHGGLVTLKDLDPLPEVLLAETSITDGLHAVKMLSTIIAIMNDDGIYVPVTYAEPLGISTESNARQTPVVFKRKFAQIR